MKQSIKRVLLINLWLSLILAWLVLGGSVRLAQAKTNQQETGCVHPTPPSPIIVDGVRYAAEQITRFNGQCLMTMGDDKPLKYGLIYIFSNEEAAEIYMQSLQRTNFDPGEGQIYIVQANDWLSKIASHFYNDPLYWPVIQEATNMKAAEDNSFATIGDASSIEIGQKVWIPELVTPPH